MLFEVKERVFEETRKVWSVLEQTAAAAVERVNRGDTLERDLSEEHIVSLITQVTHIRVVGEDGEKGEWEPWHEKPKVYSPAELRAQISEWFGSKPSMADMVEIIDHYEQANELLLRLREEMEADSDNH